MDHAAFEVLERLRPFPIFRLFHGVIMRLSIALSLLLFTCLIQAQNTENAPAKADIEHPQLTNGAPPVVQQVASQNPVSQNKKDAPYDASKDCLYRIYLGATIFGVFVALGGVFAIYKQIEATRQATQETARAAKATEEAATAAKINSQAIINAERPWLFIATSEPKPDPRNTIAQFRVINRGRTPAEVLIFTGAFMFSDMNSLPAVPTYGLEGQQFSHTKYLAPDDPLEIYSFNCESVMQEEDWKRITNEREYLVFFGHVVYRDLITREEHETRYCYWLSPAPWVGLIIGGHPGGEWNKHT
jgi:hypothetical protein